MISNIHNYDASKFKDGEDIVCFEANPIITINHTYHTIANRDRLVEANPEIRNDLDKIAAAFAGFPDSVTILGVVRPDGFRMFEAYFKLRRFNYDKQEETKEWRSGRIEMEHLSLRTGVALESPIFKGRFSKRIVDALDKPFLIRKGDRFYLKED